MLKQKGGRSRLNGHPDSSKPGTGGRNNGIKIRNHEMPNIVVMHTESRGMIGAMSVP